MNVSVVKIIVATLPLLIACQHPDVTQYSVRTGANVQGPYPEHTLSIPVDVRSSSGLNNFARLNNKAQDVCEKQRVEVITAGPFPYGYYTLVFRCREKMTPL